MAFFRLVAGNDTLPAIRGNGLYLRAPRQSDYEAWAALRQESRDFLTPWEPVWADDDLTRAAFKRRIRRYMDEIITDTSYPFFIFRDDDMLVGGITVGLVRRGVAQMATVGYWIGEPHARRGLMSIALRLTLDHAFNAMGLRRIEAACLPENIASQKLLLKCGFRYEGLARDYLCIAGQWRDHHLYAVLRSD